MAVPPESIAPVVNALIGVEANDETVAKLQLAARWAERYAGTSDDLTEVLRQFRRAYAFVDAVTNGIEPVEL